MIELFYTQDFLEDLNWLRKSNRKLFEKVRNLSLDIAKHPAVGIGKPERLKYYSNMVYSRRIDKKNRLIYEIVNEKCVKMLRCRKHYSAR